MVELQEPSVSAFADWAANTAVKARTVRHEIATNENPPNFLDCSRRVEADLMCSGNQVQL